MPSPSMLMAIAALGGVLVGLLTLVLGAVTLLWNKLDRRFDDLKTDVNQRFDAADRQRREDRAYMDKRFGELAALVQEALKART